jgi:hypothetical protein
MAMLSGRVERMCVIRFAARWAGLSAKERSEMKRRGIISDAEPRERRRGEVAVVNEGGAEAGAGDDDAVDGVGVGELTIIVFGATDHGW